MINMYSRTALILCHLFIQIFWTATSRGRNVESFLKTWMHIRSVPIVIFEILGFLQVFFLPYLAFPLPVRHESLLEVLGLILSISGTALAAWAKIVMGTSWGRPAQHDQKIQSRLVTTGPFLYSRNPIYVGLFFLFFGQQIALQSYGVFIACIFAYAIKQAVTSEEQLLKQYFGKKYLEYQKRVPRFL